MQEELSILRKRIVKHNVRNRKASHLIRKREDVEKNALASELISRINNGGETCKKSVLLMGKRKKRKLEDKICVIKDSQESFSSSSSSGEVIRYSEDDDTLDQYGERGRSVSSRNNNVFAHQQVFINTTHINTTNNNVNNNDSEFDQIHADNMPLKPDFIVNAEAIFGDLVLSGEEYMSCFMCKVARDDDIGGSLESYHVGVVWEMLSDNLSSMDPVILATKISAYYEENIRPDHPEFAPWSAKRVFIHIIRELPDVLAKKFYVYIMKQNAFKMNYFLFKEKPGGAHICDTKVQESFLKTVKYIEQFSREEAKVDNVASTKKKLSKLCNNNSSIYDFFATRESKRTTNSINQQLVYE